MPIDIGGFATLLQVFDMPASLAFYRDVLGFEVLAETSDWAHLQIEGTELMLNTAYESHERPPRPDPVRIAHHDDTALYFGCSDVDAAYEYLQSKGLHPAAPVIRDYGMKQVYLSDPDGYNLCFQCPAE
jgi:glyoxylase I family protein